MDSGPPLLRSHGLVVLFPSTKYLEVRTLALFPGCVLDSLGFTAIMTYFKKWFNRLGSDMSQIRAPRGGVCSVGCTLLGETKTESLLSGLEKQISARL